MPNYVVPRGHRTIIDNEILEGGATVSLSRESGDPLVERGILEHSPTQARQAKATEPKADEGKSAATKPARSRKTGWGSGKGDESEG